MVVPLLFYYKIFLYFLFIKSSTKFDFYIFGIIFIP